VTAFSMSDTTEKQSCSVSVVIPAYNAEKYIGRAIDSVLAQTRQADEIIVVDDGSTDSTADVVQAYGDKVHFIRQKNGGASVARNTGIEAANSEWIAFLDADDEWLPGKLEKQIEHLKRNPDLLWTHSNYFTLSAVDDTQKVAFAPDCYEEFLKGELFEDYLSIHVAAPIRTSTVIIKKEVLVRSGLFLVGQLWSQDTDIFFRIAYRVPMVGFITEPLAAYYADVPGCITLKNLCRAEQRCDFLERHLKQAAREGRSKEFEPCARQLAAKWLRAIIYNRCFGEAGIFTDRLGYLLEPRFRTEVKLKIKFPRLATFVFAVYFRLKNVIRINKVWVTGLLYMSILNSCSE
jgi:glycosyltransferase involved in cell wall biosynthesis